ncbi:hypothetical protein EDB81DRAFT_487913 [Dactylonectria macrodidyma]|uniref:Azaphilone pigments biosynthesis cluster protein L N-terminal domain-containing protein n=1 Tax=Dactylonectria macrodidyma TaxID=307937 RepID=A0A9P9J7N8_9HYPO|nr:hypothetical protein EDB81DRAFT_487913 [Dactylonectria macrodidyma]
MDPASLAFGVVSLAMQLVQAATTIRKLIAIYKSAAKELAILSDKLEDIEAICHSLEVALTASEQAPKPWDVILLKKLHKTMAGCRDKVVQLHELISKITSGPARKRNPLSTMGAMFLHQRGKIQQYNEDLDSSLQSLHLQMTTNLFVMNMSLAQPCKTIAVAVCSDQNQESNAPELIKSSYSQEVEYWKQGWFSVFCLQKTTIRKTSTNCWGSDSVTREDLSFLASSPLLGLYVKLSIQSGSISPWSISLQFPHVLGILGESNGLGDRLQGIMMENDLGGFQNLLVERLITLDTMVTSRKDVADPEFSLFGLATLYRAYDVCRFLIQQTPDISQQNHMSPNRSIAWISGPASDVRVVYDYIDIRREFITPLEFQTLLGSTYDTDFIRECVHACKSGVSLNWAPFNCEVFKMALDAFKKRDDPSIGAYDLKGWAQIIKDVLLNGLDIHSTNWASTTGFESRDSAFSRIIRSTDTSANALVNAEAWVHVLELAGVDIEEYLQVEIEQCASIWDESASYCGWHGPDVVYKRRFVVQESRGRRLPCWVEVFPDSCSTRDVFVEFPHLRQESSFGRRWLLPSSTGGHLAWKCPVWISTYAMMDTSSEPSYPVYPPLDRRNSCYFGNRVNFQESWQARLAGLNHACDLMESRFERKQAKKRRKAGGMKALKLKGRIPGAWDDEFDY